MTLVGIPLEQQDSCFRLVAAVLHMGNLEFAEGGEQDSSKLAPAAAKHLDACAMLLGVRSDGLLKALTTRTRQTVDGQWLPALALCCSRSTIGSHAGNLGRHTSCCASRACLHGLANSV